MRILLICVAWLISITAYAGQVPNPLNIQGSVTISHIVCAAGGQNFVDCGAPGGTGNVVGPAGAVNNHIPFFNGVTGLIIKDSGIGIGTSGAAIPLLSTANTWTLAQSAPSFIAGSTTLSNSGVTSSGTVTVAYGSSGTANFQDSVNGLGFVVGGSSSAITGNITMRPGVGNAPAAFLAGGSFANQSIAFRPAAQGNVNVLGMGLSGTYIQQASNAFNCGGITATVTICNNTDVMAAQGVGSVPPHSLDVTRLVGGSGTTGGRWAMNVLLQLNGGPTSDNQNVFYQATNIQALASSPMGGSGSTYLGSLFSEGLYAFAGTGATNLLELAGREQDIAIQTGASVYKVHADSIVLGGTNVNAPILEETGYSISAQGGATATIDCGLCFGRADGFNAFSAAAALIGFHPANFTGVGPTVAFGVDFRLLSFSGAPIALNGGDYYGNGNIRIGHTLISDASGGTTIDPTGSTATTATVSTPGSGYALSPGGNLTDANGGVWQIASLSGSGVATVTNRRPAYATGVPPVTLALTSGPTQAGTGAVITPTWVTGTTVTLAGNVVVSTLASGTPATYACFTAGGQIISSGAPC